MSDYDQSHRERLLRRARQYTDAFKRQKLVKGLWPPYVDA